jgi:hypothetical protein
MTAAVGNPRIQTKCPKKSSFRAMLEDEVWNLNNFIDKRMRMKKKVEAEIRHLTSKSVTHLPPMHHSATP